MVDVSWTVDQADLDASGVNENAPARLMSDLGGGVVDTPHSIAGGVASLAPNFGVVDDALFLIAAAYGGADDTQMAATAWPAMPVVDPPPDDPDPTWTPWVQTSNTLPAPSDAVTGFQVTSDDALLHVQFNRYEGAIEYDLQFHGVDGNTWLDLATLPQVAGAVQTWDYPWPGDVRFTGGQIYIYRLRARLT